MVCDMEWLVDDVIKYTFNKGCRKLQKKNHWMIHNTQKIQQKCYEQVKKVIMNQRRQGSFIKKQAIL